jgi:hypothetical protein
MRKVEGLDLGDYRLLATGTEVPVSGETAKRQLSRGTAAEYRLVGSDGIKLTLHDSRWTNGDRDVRAVTRNTTPETYDGIINRLRLGVDRAGEDLVVELQQARLNAMGRPQRRIASLRNSTTGRRFGLGCPTSIGCRYRHEAGAARDNGSEPRRSVRPISVYS